jgi:hypothetical protein
VRSHGPRLVDGDHVVHDVFDDLDDGGPDHDHLHDGGPDHDDRRPDRQRHGHGADLLDLHDDDDLHQVRVDRGE